MTYKQPTLVLHPFRVFIVKPLAVALFLLFLLGAAPAWGEPGLFDLGELNGGTMSEARGVNATGDVVVGTAADGSASNRNRAFRWTEATGLQSLGTLNDGTSSTAYAVNAAGDVVVGFSTDGSSSIYSRAFRWTEATGMQSLGTLNGGRSSTAYAVNAAGDVVVGDATDGSAGNAPRAFRWTEATGMQSLGTLNGGMNSTAYAVNAAGDVVVGAAADGSVSNNYRAFRWTEATGMQNLGTLNGGTYSMAYGVNAAGDVVIGFATDGSAGGSYRAFRWATDGGMQSLGALRGHTDSIAYGVNASGDVVVGFSRNGGASSTERAFRWTQATGMQSIEDWLTANGVRVDPAAVKTRHALGVNATGDVVVGYLHNSHAFIASTKGMLDLVENNRSLAASAGVSTQAVLDASLALHGAHGSPMRTRLASGRQSTWVASDWGRTDSAEDGNVGTGEFGYARGLSDAVTVKLALGRTYSKVDTDFGGYARTTGTYILPEVIAKIDRTSLYVTLSGYYNKGEADIRRGYDNAGTREYASGSPDTETAAARVRLDWLDAAQFGNTALTPYTSLSCIKSRIASYTETGGAFPAHWNSRKEHATEARLGVDAVQRIDAALNFLGRLEGVHRFNSEGAAASGDVDGRYGFFLVGQEHKRNWLRTGVGVEGKMAGGMGSLMLNASTESDAVRYWLAASYRTDF